LKRQQNGVSPVRNDKAADGRMHLRFEELNRAYAELVRKYKEINKERNELMGTIEDLARANKLMEQDFQALFK
jgi:hypothetical protein